MCIAARCRSPTCRGSDVTTATALRPTTTTEIAEAFAVAMNSGGVIEIRGGGSKAAMARPQRATTAMDMSAFASVVDYDPRELVLTVGAGARLSEIETLVAAQNQMLAFEPFDHGSILGTASGNATIGGIVAANVSGSRRLSAGSARDHVLGIEGVSGRGEVFKAGGRVVKNVTGYDLPKLMAGSWGRLAALTTITLKVLPRPRAGVTVIVRGLSDENAATVMTRATGSTTEVSGAAHVPAHAGVEAATALRVEGVGPSVKARAATLAALFRADGPVETLENDASTSFWERLRDLDPLKSSPSEALLWRINGRPTRTWQVPSLFATSGARWFYDWAGGLIWLTTTPDTDPAFVRRTAAHAGAQATLIRAPESVRAATPMLHEEPTIADLSKRVKAAFDPANILDPYRFHAGTI